MMNTISAAYTKCLQLIITALLACAGVGVLAMIAITCTDVVTRRFGVAITGACDLVMIFSLITLSCAMPYTTAVKGHVAIEFFFHKLSRKTRMITDALMRSLSIALFLLFTIKSFAFGGQLKMNGQVTQTIQIPVFWLAYVLSFSCFIVVLVIAYSLVAPNKELVKL